MESASTEHAGKLPGGVIESGCNVLLHAVKVTFKPLTKRKSPPPCLSSLAGCLDGPGLVDVESPAIPPDWSTAKPNARVAIRNEAVSGPSPVNMHVR
jgi:hypothetical protein